MGNNLIYEGDGNTSDYLGKCYNYGYWLISSHDNNASAPTLYEKDGHGSVVMTLDSGYSNMSMPSYDAFGVSSSAISSTTDPMRYCGEYQDYESGLIYLRARYYSPQIGRFASEDPHWKTAFIIEAWGLRRISVLLDACKAIIESVAVSLQKILQKQIRNMEKRLENDSLLC